jgi:hypothetical protein
MQNKPQLSKVYGAINSRCMVGLVWSSSTRSGETMSRIRLKERRLLAPNIQLALEVMLNT